MVSCGPSREELEAQEKEQAAQAAVAQPTIVDSSAKVYASNSHFTIGLYQVNGCEYLAFIPADRQQGEGVAVIHAGNCNNPIHYEHEKAVEELSSTIIKHTTNSPY